MVSLLSTIKLTAVEASSLLYIMDCISMYLVLVIVLSTSLALVDGECDIYSMSLSSTDRCRKVQDCVNAAFFNDKNNLYVLGKVFQNTESQPPIALIVNYHVTLHNVNNDSGNGSSTLSDSNIGEFDTEKSNDTTRVHYEEQLGWSSTAIYKAIHPLILLSLQPPLCYWVLLLARDDHALPRSINLELNTINTAECDLLGFINQSEIKEALKHLTMKMNYNITGKVAYIWITDLNSYKYDWHEQMLFMNVMILVFLTGVLMIFILRKVHCKGNTIHTTTFVTFTIFMIIFEFLTGLHARLHSNLTYALILQSLPIFFVIFGLIVSCWHGTKHSYSHHRIIQTALIMYPTLSTASYFFPVLIETFIYPTEILSSFGFIAICVVVIFVGYNIILKSLSGGSRQLNKTEQDKTDISPLNIILLGIYFCTFSLLFYLSLLEHLFETPKGHFFQILITFSPPIVIGLGTFLLKKKLEGKNRPKEKGDYDKKNSEVQQKQYTNKADHHNEATREIHEESQADLRRQLQEQTRSDTQQQGTLERISHEMQEPLLADVEVHKDNSEKESESAV